MNPPCEHLGLVREVTPSANGCEDCLRTGDEWVHLRLCMTCGHVGCCDDSSNRHASAHWHAHPEHPGQFDGAARERDPAAGVPGPGQPGRRHDVDQRGERGEQIRHRRLVELRGDLQAGP